MDSRIEMPDYCERSVFEALVNALIHRDYLILGSEVHIDIYDDRLTIYSPGGMADGTRIQELEPKFYSDVTSFQVTLYNLNYGTSEKVAVEEKKVALAHGKVAFEVKKAAFRNPLNQGIYQTRPGQI